MGVLKNIGYVILSILGLCLTAGVCVFISLFGAALGALATGAALVALVAMGIKEYFEKPPDNRDT